MDLQQNILACITNFGNQIADASWNLSCLGAFSCFQFSMPSYILGGWQFDFIFFNCSQKETLKMSSCQLDILMQLMLIYLHRK